MMAELNVVSSIVFFAVVGMYSSYNKIYSIYKNRIGYYDITTLYKLGFYRDVLVENNKINDMMTQSKSSKVVDVKITSYISGPEFSGVTDQVFMLYNNRSKINSDIFDSIEVNTTFKDYVDYLENKIDFSEFEYMMIMERCAIKDDGSVNIDDCSYAYLEIFE